MAALAVATEAYLVVKLETQKLDSIRNEQTVGKHDCLVVSDTAAAVPVAPLGIQVDGINGRPVFMQAILVVFLRAVVLGARYGRHAAATAGHLRHHLLHCRHLVRGHRRWRGCLRLWGIREVELRVSATHVRDTHLRVVVKLDHRRGGARRSGPRGREGNFFFLPRGHTS